MHACKDHTHKRLEEPEEQVGVELLVDGDVAGVALDPEKRRDPRPPPRLNRARDGAEEERAATDVLPRAVQFKDRFKDLK